MELFRDQAAEHFERPHRLALAAAHRLDGQPPATLTAAMIDSREFLDRAGAAPRPSVLRAGRTEDRPHRRCSTSTTTSSSGRRSTRFTPSIPTWCSRLTGIMAMAKDATS